MTTSTIVAFHIGRGGRFHNPGFLTFIGENKISKYTDDLFLSFDMTAALKLVKLKFTDYFWKNGQIDGRKDIESYFIDLITDEKYDDLQEIFGITLQQLGEKEHRDANGNSTGLTEAESDSGIGRINIDDSYDTTYTCLLSDCDEKQLQAILDYQGYVHDEIRSYAKDYFAESEENA
jgi:hypothetical protein